MNEEIYEALKEVTRSETVTTYTPIAALVGLDMEREADRVEMGRLLGEISCHEHRHGRPLLSVVVVHGERGEATGLPGPGFFDLARELGVMCGNDRVTFFARELTRVHEAWRP